MGRFLDLLVMMMMVMVFVFATIFVIIIMLGYEYPWALTAYGDTMNWNTMRFDECNMNMNYPTSFKTEETTNELENNADFTIYSDEPHIQVSVDCNDLDINLSKDDYTNDVIQIQEKLMGYDDFIVQDINFTKWTIDSQNTTSFIFESGENAHTGVVTTNEIIYVLHKDIPIMIKFIALYTEFDSPQIQKLEKRIINSIKLL
ncbi:MAG TPA: hypothetical protein VJR94_03925 [Candidatus Nitrosocosmicus sp.]|nr:hypothetical protein [Candidatus Nitrosocosmicus sp.]